MEAAPIPRYLSRLDYNKLMEFRRTGISESVPLLVGAHFYYTLSDRTSFG
ncbi:unnamed protein product [Gongylonema pulchrum]|uniref:Uncharacterized protein n=1 Tax=Gongylonema pulchrum TaxID=637853 RepID=A0A183DH30_9BILA|nr:unnamed protein product [Gongylonema pulchrum]